MTERSLATSADYADALLVARKAKNTLFLLILLMLLAQLALFFVARYTDLVVTRASPPAATPATPAPEADAPATTAPTTDAGETAAATATTLPVAEEAAPPTPPPTPPAAPSRGPAGRSFLHYLSGIVLFLGTILPILLAFILLLIVHIMLVGRLIGVAQTTSAFLWCLVLMLLMFPWQIFFGASSDPTDFRLPGVLYTWNDLRSYARFDAGNLHLAIVKWARFCAMPIVATLLLMIVQIKSNRGLRQALGETPVENIQISV